MNKKTYTNIIDINRHYIFTKFSLYIMILLGISILGIKFVFFNAGATNNCNMYWSSIAADTSFETTATGEIGQPYKISTATQLATIAKYISTYKNKSFILTNDIDISAYNWIPIGSSSCPYQGNFDGAGFSIVGLRINSTDNLAIAGFFGHIHSATIVNLNFVAKSNSIVVANITTSSDAFAGVLAAFSDGTTTIYNVSNYGVPVFTICCKGFSYAGGLIGYSTDTTYSRVANMANVTAYSTSTLSAYSGGIVGKVIGSSATIDYAKNNGSIEAHTNSTVTLYCGGVAGFCSVVVTNVYNTGKIQAGNILFDLTIEAINYHRSKPNVAYAGGILGYTTQDITNSFNTASVTADALENNNNCKTPLSAYTTQSEDIVDASYLVFYYWTAYVSSYVNNDVTEQNKEKIGATTQITSLAYAGGIVGYSEKEVVNAYNDGVIKGGKKKIRIVYGQSIRYRVKNSFQAFINQSASTYFSTVTYNHTLFYGAINGYRAKTTTNTYGQSQFFDFTRSVTVNSYKNGIELFSGKNYNSKSSGVLTAKPIVRTLDNYVSEILYKVQLEVGENNLFYKAYQTHVSYCKFMGDKRTTITGVNQSGNIEQNVNHAVMAATSIKASDLGSGWKTQNGINSGRPYLENFYW